MNPNEWVVCPMCHGGGWTAGPMMERETCDLCSGEKLVRQSRVEAWRADPSQTFPRERVP